MLEFLPKKELSLVLQSGNIQELSEVDLVEKKKIKKESLDKREKLYQEYLHNKLNNIYKKFNLIYENINKNT